MNIILLLFSATIVLGFIMGKFWSKTAHKLQKKLTLKTSLGEYHIHHSIGGLIIILLSVLIPTASLKTILIGLGLGILSEHTLSEGFKFITKEKPLLTFKKPLLHNK